MANAPAKNVADHLQVSLEQGWVGTVDKGLAVYDYLEEPSGRGSDPAERVFFKLLQEKFTMS